MSHRDDIICQGDCLHVSNVLTYWLGSLSQSTKCHSNALLWTLHIWHHATNYITWLLQISEFYIVGDPVAPCKVTAFSFLLWQAFRDVGVTIHLRVTLCDFTKQMVLTFCWSICFNVCKPRDAESRLLSWNAGGKWMGTKGDRKIG